MPRLWVLGSADPEMEAIERLLVACGERIAYAVDLTTTAPAIRATGASPKNSSGPARWSSSHDTPHPDCPSCRPHVSVRDMRREQPVPELPEAAAQDGIAYVSGPLIGPGGRRKYTCSGPSELIESRLAGEGLAGELIARYGDPARGFAGGYLHGTDACGGLPGDGGGS